MKKSVLVVATVLVAALVWQLAFSDGSTLPEVPAAEGTAPPPGGDPLRAPTPRAGTPDDPPAPGSGDAEPERVEVEAVTPPADAATTVTLRGRCVDARSMQPLAGCALEAHGWGANSSRMDAHVKEHGEVVWQDPEPQTTGPDGTFSFTFVPPPPYQFSLDVQRAGFISLSGRWGTLEPGTVKDFGDVPMTAGSRVTGIVRDTDGVPQRRVRVHLDQYNRSDRTRIAGMEELAPRNGYSQRTRDDGTFEMRDAMAFGTWNVDVRERQLVKPSEVNIADPFQHVEITTKAQREIESITGIVVDENDAPVPRVEVEYSPRKHGGGWINSTARDGTFTVERKDGDPGGPVQLTFDREGYELGRPVDKVSWGTRALRIVLRSGLGVEVVVTDAETDEPVEDFGVRCHPAPGSAGRWSSRDQRVRARGQHPGGRVTLRGLRRGRQVLIVEPTGADYLTSAPQTFEVTDDGAPPQHVAVSRPVTVKVIVQRAGGEPVAGTRVELLQPLTESPVTLKTYVPDAGAFSSNADQATRLSDGTTDERGELTVRGPARAGLALRVLGPGHEPLAVNGVELAPGRDPLVVEVAAGGTVTATIGPPAFLEQYRAGHESRWQRPPLGLALTRREGTTEQRIPAGYGGGAPVSASGRVEMTGIPPGTWDVWLEYLFETSGNVMTGGRQLVATVSLVGDGSRHLSFDGSHLLFGTVRARVLQDDEPVEGAHVALQGLRPDGKGGQQPEHPGQAVSDADGAIELRVVPATYRASIRLPDTTSSFRIGEEFTVVPGQAEEQVFDIRVGTLRLRVLGSDGEPLSQVSVSLLRKGDRHGQSLLPTDAEGWTQADPAPAGTLKVTTMPKHLTTPAGWQAFHEAHGNDPEAWLNAMVTIGEVTVTAGKETTTAALRMPPTAGY